MSVEDEDYRERYKREYQMRKETERRREEEEREQKEREQKDLEVAEKLRQEMEDAEFARRLQEEDSLQVAREIEGRFVTEETDGVRPPDDSYRERLIGGTGDYFSPPLQHLESPVRSTRNNNNNSDARVGSSSLPINVDDDEEFARRLQEAEYANEADLPTHQKSSNNRNIPINDDYSSIISPPSNEASPNRLNDSDNDEKIAM